MENAIGESYMSEIFLHESCIYTQVAHQLRQMGFRVLQIYNGFFTDKPLDRNVFNEVVCEKSLSYYRDFRKYSHPVIPRLRFESECLHY